MNPRLPSGRGWLFEPLLDGRRLIAEVARGRVTLRDPGGGVVAEPALARALAALPDAVLDGVVAGDPPVYWAFDLLALDGRSLAASPLAARKRALARVVDGETVRMVAHFTGDGARVLDAACRVGARGVIAKRARAARRDGWVAVECPRDPRPLRGAAPGAAAIANRAARSGGRRTVEIAGVRLTHADRAFWPGITKEGLARYYEAVAGAIVPSLRGRPLTLVRCPDGVAGGCAYLRHARAWGPPALRRVAVAEKEKVGEYLVADDLAGVIALVQMDILEIHTWNARADDLERPDRLVLDLDPSPSVPFAEVAAAAARVREALAARGLAAFPKTTGGRGLHLLVPLAPAADWAACLAFARAFARALAADDPRTFTVELAKARRRGRIFLDWLRNNRGNTAVAAWSTRARAGAPVSIPVSWDELPSLDPARFTVATAPSRAALDPWPGYRAARRRLPPLR